MGIRTHRCQEVLDLGAHRPEAGAHQADLVTYCEQVDKEFALPGLEPRSNIEVVPYLDAKGDEFVPLEPDDRDILPIRTPRGPALETRPNRPRRGAEGYCDERDEGWASPLLDLNLGVLNPEGRIQ